MKGWLDKLQSHRIVTIVQIIAATASAICLGTATWITTLQVPKIKANIDKQESIINELRYQTTQDLVQGLYAMDVYTDRRINIIDIRLERMMNKSRTKLEELLLEEVVKKTVEQIKRWDSLFVPKQGHGTSTELPIFGPNTPPEQRIAKLEPVLLRARRAAYSRLEEVIERVHTYESQKEEHEGKQKAREATFTLFQMIGLLTLVVAIALEAYKKLGGIVTHKKGSDMCEHVAEPDHG